MSESLGIGRARQWLQEDPNRVYGSILPLSRDKAGGGLRLALPTAARDLGRGVLDMLEGHMTPEASMALLDVPTGGLMRAAAIGARVPATQLGIFAGVGAKTANKAALETAQRMASEGADPRAIWRDTGWFQGPEGKWRWEIDDSGVAIDPSQMRQRAGREESVGRTSNFTSLLPHQDLLEAYPDVGSIKGRITVGKYQPEEGAIKNWGKERIRVTAPDDELARSVGLHELQHAVQGREGFARGGSVSEYARGPMFDRRAKDLNADLSQALTGGVSAKPDEVLMAVKYGDPEELATIAQRHGFVSVDEALEFLRYQDEKRTPYSQYRRTAGEAEARAVQKRMDMTPEQRRAAFPLDSYDVPLDELIVRGAEVDPEFRRLWLQGNAT